MTEAYRTLAAAHRKNTATKNTKFKKLAAPTLGLDWRELEWLCGVAYEHMGFQVIVTPRGNDDGADVLASDRTPGHKGLVVIQSKKWDDSNPVGKAQVRELLGTVVLHKATKGVLVTTGRYETGALEMAEDDPRIELLDRQQILLLLNEHCGADWFTRVDRLISFIKLGDPMVGK